MFKLKLCSTEMPKLLQFTIKAQNSHRQP